VTQPSRDVLQSVEMLNRDRNFKAVLTWLNDERALIARQTNLMKSTEDMLRSAGRYQQMEEILKYLEHPSLYLGG
jgi:hypothetical protein